MTPLWGSVVDCRGLSESDKLKNMPLRRLKRRGRKPKNVLNEFRSEDLSGQMDYDVDSVLQELGEATETETEKKKKGKTKKNKAEKSRGKRQQRCVEEEVDENQEDPEAIAKIAYSISSLDVETDTKAKILLSHMLHGTDGDPCLRMDLVNEVINHDISDLSGMDLNNVKVESEEMDNRADIDLGETLEQDEMKSQRENELRSQQMSMEANLQELLNKHMSELDCKVTEMSQLIFRLDGAEEEKAKIEKQVLQIDADVRELQDRREKLISRTTDNDKKVAKIKEKKDKLEKYIDKKRGNWEKAKAQLEHEMEEIKIEITNLRKFDDFSKVARVQPENDKMKNLRKLESKIEAKEKDLECSVCLEVASVPIFCCGAQHVICDSCRPKVTM